ncbi:MAG: hypothetical protein FVQ84_22355, partial [Planctomycetes bacterium]|nr:hypothetical protein [Planctomycetota bacterium]
MSKKLIYLTSFVLVLSLAGKGWSYASMPSPADGALHEDPWATLSWVPGPNAVLYDIYLGENYDDVNQGTGGTFRGNQSKLVFVVGFPGFPYPDGLIPGTTYYWRIDEINDLHPDSPWIGDVWSFTIPPPSTTHAPEPADGALHEDPWATLSWVPGPNAVSYDIYLGENYDDVNQGTGGTFRGNQSKLVFVVGFPGFPYPNGLVPGTTYYWRIDEVNDLHPDSPWIGDVWSFTVPPPPSTTHAPEPADGALHEDPWATLSWVPGPNAVSYDIYLGENYDDVNQGTGGTFRGNQSKLVFVVGFPGFPYPDGLIPGTTYYWRIDEINDLHPDSPWIGDV